MTSDQMLWVLLVYTVPATPSRKRAAVWRELKKAGSIYLRDGVCILPQREATQAIFLAIADRVAEFEGQATLVQGAQLDPERAARLVEQFRAERAAEYGELCREAERFLEHIRHETAHRDFTFAELEELEEDLGKLTRWAAQVRAREYFAVAEARQLAALLDHCDAELATFLESAARQVAVPQ